MGVWRRLNLLGPLALLLAQLLLTSHPASAECVQYTGTLCPYLLNSMVKSSFPIALTESLLVDLGFGDLTSIGGTIDPICADVALHYVCEQYFQGCETLGNVTVVTPPCQSLCNSYVAECADILTAQGAADLIPDCSTYAQSDCTSYDYNHNLPSNFECPPPLILRPQGDNSNETCIGECCVPCPQTHFFYPEGHVAIVDKVVIVVALVSLFGSLFTSVTFALMPEKRSYPSTTILCMAISFLFIYFPVFALVGNPNRVRCINEVTQSLPGHNENPICQFQSTLLIFGFLSGVFWFFLLVINIYVSVIFLSKRMQDFKYWFQPIGWGFPWIFVIAAHATKSTGYAFGISCVIDTGDIMNALLLGPIACMIFPAVLLNLHVLIKIFMVAKKRNASLQAILRLQLRSFFFVTTCLIVFLFYWIFVEVDVNGLKIDHNASWVQEWYICVATGRGQNECSLIAAPNMPTLAPFALAEILVYGLGIVIFGFFSCKMEVFYFWRELLTGNTKRITSATASVLSTPEATNKSQRSTKADEEIEFKKDLKASKNSTSSTSQLHVAVPPSPSALEADAS